MTHLFEFCISVVVSYDARLNNSSDSVETQIVTEYKKLYSESSETRLQSALKKINELETELHQLGAGIKLIALKKQNSIGSYFLCTKLDALRRLNRMYKSGALKRRLENIFNQLLTENTQIQIKSFTTNKEEYKKCKKYFHSIKGLSILFGRTSILNTFLCASCIAYQLAAIVLSLLHTVPKF